MKKLLLSITTRIMVFNGLILFVLAVAFLGFDRYETQLLASQERAMVQQGRLMASVLSGRESLNADEARRVLAQLRGAHRGSHSGYRQGRRPFGRLQRGGPAPARSGAGA